MLKIVLVGNLIALIVLIVFVVFVFPLSTVERVSLAVVFATLAGLNWALLLKLDEKNGPGQD